jgi:hypothetical protein
MQYERNSILTQQWVYPVERKQIGFDKQIPLSKWNMISYIKGISALRTRLPNKMFPAYISRFWDIVVEWALVNSIDDLAIKAPTTARTLFQEVDQLQLILTISMLLIAYFVIINFSRWAIDVVVRLIEFVSFLFMTTFITLLLCGYIWVHYIDVQTTMTNL